MKRRQFARLCAAGAAAAVFPGAAWALTRRTARGPKADRVLVIKHERRLYLMRGTEVLRTYRVALGRYPRGHKIREGDARTPEGRYTLDFKMVDSDFYRAIHISYPNARDLANAQSIGVSPGGQIMIHGLPNQKRARDVGHPTLDWTQGCIAVTNRELDEIWRSVEEGTPIWIIP